MHPGLGDIKNTKLFVVCTPLCARQVAGLLRQQRKHFHGDKLLNIQCSAGEFEAGAHAVPLSALREEGVARCCRLLRCFQN